MKHKNMKKIKFFYCFFSFPNKKTLRLIQPKGFDVIFFSSRFQPLAFSIKLSCCACGGRPCRDR